MTAATKGNFGIVVSGGPAPGINGVINACVIAAASRGYNTFGLVDGFRGVCTEAANPIVSLKVEEIARIYGTGGSILGIARLNPLADQKYEKRLMSALEQNGIDKLVVIGGDGSALLSHALHTKYPDLNVVHVPKTIDNDLILPNEHPSFGFETARYAGTEILETLKTDARTSKRWFVVESMGRRAGFLALGLGVASGSPLTIIPEEYEGKTTTPRALAEVVLNTMLKRHQMNKPCGVVILAEGLIDCIDPNSSPVLKNAPHDDLGRLIHSEIEFGEIIRTELRTLLLSSGLKTKINTKNLGYELRCHKPISFDIEYSRFLGVGAVEHLLNGMRGIMVTREYDKLGHMSLESMLDQSGKIRSRKVNLKSDLYRVARTFMIGNSTFSLMKSETSKTLLRGTGTVSILTLVSRVLGLVRDQIIAFAIGTSAVADAFFVAFRIPNLLRSFVGEGALTSAFVPVFSTELEQGKDKALRALRSVGGLLLLITALLTVLGLIFAPLIIRIIAPGFVATPENFSLCTTLTRIMFPLVICVGFVAMLSGALNTVKVFGIGPLAQIVMNLVLMVGGVVALAGESERDIALLLAIFVPLGGIAQIIAQVPALKRAGFGFLPSFQIISPESRQVLKLLLPAILGAAVYQLLIFVNTMLASMLETGSVSWLFYADRLTQLPVGIFSIALASVLLPTLSTASARGDGSVFNSSLTDALRYTSFVIIPAACGLYFFAEPIIAVLFQRGAFEARDTFKTAIAVQAICFGLWGISCHSMVVRAFLAKKDTVTPMLISATTVVISVMLTLILMGPPTQASASGLGKVIVELQQLLSPLAPGVALGHVGVALASSTVPTLAFLALALILTKQHAELVWRDFFVATSRALLASFVMVLSLKLIAPPELTPLLRLIVGIPIGVLIFFAVSLLIRAREAKETFALIRRLIK